MATPAFGAVQPTGNQNIDSLLWGDRWVGGDVLFTFAEGPFTLNSGDSVTGDPWLDYETQAFLTAMARWEAVANITFSQVGSGGNLKFYSIDARDAGGTLAQQSGPFDESGASLGIGLYNWQGFGWSQEGLQPGGYGFLTVTHELGHALGLAHPFDEGGESGVILTVLDTDVFTLMSYNNFTELLSGDVILSYGNAATPMPLDIAAIQHIYGPNLDYARGNDVYSLPDSNGPGTYWSAIWDAGGHDVITAEGTSRTSYIDLRPATLEGIGAGGYLSAVIDVYGGYTIANSVVIEEGRGGSGDDSVVGNDFANWLYGNAGDDTLFGFSGDDYMEAGEGADYMNGNQGADRLFGLEGNDYLHGGRDDDQVFAGGGDDRVFGDLGADFVAGDAGLDFLQGGPGHDLLFGGADSDTQRGGQGDDLLYGQSGDDHLYGDKGNDTLFGGEGLDRAYFQGASSSYSIESLSEGYRVTNLDGTFGVDLVYEVEILQFDDTSFGL